jgi:hypothetical protein
MRGPDESVNDARDAANKFISDHEQAARNGYPKGCKDGYGKIPSSALREFGIALHTLTDMTSPAHEGFQIWHDFPEPGGDPIVNHNAMRFGESVQQITSERKREARY